MSRRAHYLGQSRSPRCALHFPNWSFQVDFAQADSFSVGRVLLRPFRLDGPAHLLQRFKDSGLIPSIPQFLLQESQTFLDLWDEKARPSIKLFTIK